MYLIIGANGFLGSYIVKNIILHSKENIIATARNTSELHDEERVKWLQIDVTRDEDIEKLQQVSCNYKNIKVVYLAAYHKPDLVQKQPRIAWNVNIIALSKVLNALENVECFFYASTDNVYGESHDGYHYKESDTLTPKNIYGLQKMTAEALVSGFGYNVVRFPFLIGRSILKHKLHFCDEIIASVQSKMKFELFRDSYRSSLDFDSAASILVLLMEKYKNNYPQILNISGDDDLSKYDIGILLAKQYGFDHNFMVPISINDDSNIFEAPRAGSILLDNTLVKNVLGINMIRIKL